MSFRLSGKQEMDVNANGAFFQVDFTSWIDLTSALTLETPYGAFHVAV